MKPFTNNSYEACCPKCQGAGLLPAKNDPACWNVHLCDGCNGHGILAIVSHTDKKTVRYDKAVHELKLKHERRA